MQLAQFPGFSDLDGIARTSSCVRNAIAIVSPATCLCARPAAVDPTFRGSLRHQLTVAYSTPKLNAIPAEIRARDNYQVLTLPNKQRSIVGAKQAHRLGKGRCSSHYASIR